MIGETADEAQARVIAPLLEKIRATVCLPADQLPEGCYVKVGGEWCRLEGRSGGSLILSSGGAGIVYPWTDGERFAWRWGAF